MAPTSTKKQRDHALDTIRIIAILDIVICHIAAGSFPAGMVQQILVALGSLGVPLFVMLTGYLMLDRTYDATYIRRFLKRNLLPLFVSLEVWNVIWFFLSHIIGDTPMRISTLLQVATFTGDSGTGFWFLPMIFALYLGLPIVSSALRYFIAQESRAYLYILAFCVIFFGTVIPTCTQLLAWSPVHFNITSVLQMNIFGTDVWGASVWILYLLLGFIFKQFSSNIERIPTWALTAVFICAFALKSLLHICAWKSNFPSDPYYANLTLVISAAALFPLLHRIFKFSSGFSQKLLPLNAQFSKLSFGVYMIHVWLYDLSMSLLAKPPISMTNQYMIFLICLLVSYFGSVLIAKLLSLVPIVRKWLLLMK